MGTIGQPPEFVGRWELVFYTLRGQAQEVEGVIEQIHADGRFEAYRNGVRIAAGRHVDFQTDPPGFTNVQEDFHVFGVRGRELTIYQLVGQMLEVCKALKVTAGPSGLDPLRERPSCMPRSDEFLTRIRVFLARATARRSAASRAISSSGSSATCVVLSRLLAATTCARIRFPKLLRDPRMSACC